MNEAQVLDVMLNAGVGVISLLVLFFAVRGFINYQKDNASTLRSILGMAEGLQTQIRATQHNLDMAQSALVAERNSSHEQLNKLGEMLLKIAEIAETTGKALARHEEKLAHLLETTDQDNASAAQRLKLLEQVIGHTGDIHSKVRGIETLTTTLIDAVRQIDERTERADIIISGLSSIPTTLEVIARLLKIKIEDANVAQKLSTGQMVATDG